MAGGQAQFCPDKTVFMLWSCDLAIKRLSFFYHRLPGAVVVTQSPFWFLNINFSLVSNINGHCRHSQLMLWDRALISPDSSRA